jgi:hypothetical protein
MKQQIEVAARWWADRLRHGAKQDNGDTLAGIFAALSRVDVDPEQVDLFERVLKSVLLVHLVRTWKPDEPQFGSAIRAIGCDYGPDNVLSEAAKAADIPTSCPPFPMKTMMWIDPDSVRVEYGYGARPVTLWATASHFDPASGAERAER